MNKLSNFNKELLLFWRCNRKLCSCKTCSYSEDRTETLHWIRAAVYRVQPLRLGMSQRWCPAPGPFSRRHPAVPPWSWRARTTRHGLGVPPLHICQTPHVCRRHPSADVGDRCAVLPRGQGAGVPGLREAVCPDELHRSPAAGFRVQPAALHGADRWAVAGRWWRS